MTRSITPYKYRASHYEEKGQWPNSQDLSARIEVDSGTNDPSAHMPPIKLDLYFKVNICFSTKGSQVLYRMGFKNGLKSILIPSDYFACDTKMKSQFSEHK